MDRRQFGRDDIDYFVLDSLANDIESLEDILRVLNSPTALGWVEEFGRPFTPQDIVPALLRGVREGTVEILVWSDRERVLVNAGEGVIPDLPPEDVWYHMTSRGRMVHEAWDPPIAQ